MNTNIKNQTPDMVLHAHLQGDSDDNDIYYFCVGTLCDKGLTGLVYGYCGGGEYSEWYILNGKYLPNTYSDGELLEDECAIAMINAANKNTNFIEQCLGVVDKYFDYQGDTYTYKLKSKYNQHVEGSDFNVGRSFIPPSYGNLTYNNFNNNSYTSIMEFINENIQIDSLVKETIAQLIEFGVGSDQSYSIHPADLIAETIRTFDSDPTYGQFIPSILVSNITTDYILGVIDRGYNLCDINIADCDRCSLCKTVWLPDDECGIEYSNKKSICNNCTQNNIGIK